jgi:hypothetical protein
VADQGPWGTWIDESDKRCEAYLAAGGKPPVMADNTFIPANFSARAGK